jgi:hypothetical protein
LRYHLKRVHNDPRKSPKSSTSGSPPPRDLFSPVPIPYTSIRALNLMVQIPSLPPFSNGSAQHPSLTKHRVERGNGRDRRQGGVYPLQETERPSGLVRRETITTEHYRRPDENSTGSREHDGKAIIGTLLGAAAGAAPVYAMVRRDEYYKEKGEPAPTERRAQRFARA